VCCRVWLAVISSGCAYETEIKNLIRNKESYPVADCCSVMQGVTVCCRVWFVAVETERQRQRDSDRDRDKDRDRDRERDRDRDRDREIV